MKDMTKIGPYEVVRLLGRGGMSEVYEVENVRLGSRHALKLFTYEKDDAGVRERFLAEGKLLAKLCHPRIVKVTDFGTDETTGRPYFVMDLILNERGEMQQLSDVQPGTVDEDMIGRWYDDLREGLAYIHKNGVVHRDLKLQNVLIGPDCHAVLTDFGISKIFDAKGDGVRIVDTVKTLVKIRGGQSLVMGSVGYMAPELEMGVEASPQSDWYALGVIAYRLLTGTWCDARTDVVGTLETYDPVWLRIIPKLLHSNPNGRECLSFAEERRLEREKTDLESENRWLAAKDRGRLARHVARSLGALSLLLAIAGAVMGWRLAKVESEDDGKGENLEFETLFTIPAAAGESDTAETPSRSRFQSAMVDALVLTHRTLADLKAGRITMARAKEDFERMQEKLERGDLDVFAGLPPSFTDSGESDALLILMRTAIKRFP